MEAVFDWFTELVSASPLTYLLVLVLTMADVTGLIPAEAVVTTATLVAVRGSLLLPGVGLASVAGVAAGDTLLFLLGRRVGARVAGRLFRGERAQERLRWAERQMSRHGAVIVVAGRWLPMGRTVTVFAAGALELPWRRFAVADSVAIALWAGYYIGVTVALGRAFLGKPWLTLVVSLGIATAAGVVAEGLRRRHVRRRLARGRGGREGDAD